MEINRQIYIIIYIYSYVLLMLSFQTKVSSSYNYYLQYFKCSVL